MYENHQLDSVSRGTVTAHATFFEHLIGNKLKGWHYPLSIVDQNSPCTFFISVLTVVITLYFVY